MMKFKQLFAPWLLCALAMVPAARGTDVLFSYGDFRQSPQANRQLFLYPLLLAPTNSVGITTGDRITVVMGTAGSVTVSNLMPGWVRGEFNGVWTKSTNFFQIPDTNGLVLARNCLGTGFLIGGPLPTPAPWWGKAELVAGNNTTYRTNGGKVYIDAGAGVTAGVTNQWMRDATNAALAIAGSNTAGVASFNARVGVVTLTSNDVGTALGYAPTNGATGPQGPQGIQGIQGVAGIDGTNGVNGTNGATGAAGAAATIAAGNVYTNAAGSAAGVTNRGTSSAAIFDFSIPVGPAGPTGPEGPAGSGTNGGLVSFQGRTNAAAVLTAADIAGAGGLTNTSVATWITSGSVDSNMVAHLYSNPRTGEIRRPLDGFCTYPSSSYTEAQILQAASNMWALGYVALGMDVFELSDGWGNTNRSVEGKLEANATRFPSGLGALALQCWNLYGVKLGYYLQGNHNTTNTVSIWGSIPTTDFSQLETDVNTMVGEWNASHIRADWYGFDDSWEAQRTYIERLTYLADYASKTNASWQRPVSFQWKTALAGVRNDIPTWVPNYANMIRVGSDYGTRALILDSLDFQKNFRHLIGPGHYIFTDTEADSGTVSGLTAGEVRRNVALGALLHSTLQFTWNGMATATPTIYPATQAAVTNTMLRDIRWDAAVNPPTISYTNLLSGTNAGECWITPLANGDYAVALWNRDTVGVELTNVIYGNPDLTTYSALMGEYRWQANITDGTLWTNVAGGYSVLYDSTASTHLSQDSYWYVTNGAGAVVYRWPYQTLTNGVVWVGTNSGLGSGFGGYYRMGREMSFGTTNIADLGTSGWTYRDIWTGWYGTATNSRTWPVPANDLALFRVSAPALWPVAATATGNIDGSNVVSGTVAPARLGSGSGGSSKFLREDSTFQEISGGGDMLKASNLSDVADAGTSRTNLAAHNASNLTTGTVATNLLPVLLAANVTGNAATVTSISGNSLTTAQVTNALTDFAITNKLGNALNGAQITGNIAGQAGTVASISANSLTTAQVTNALTDFAITNRLGNALNGAQITGNIAGQAGTVASISANSLTTAQVTNALTDFAITNRLGNALNGAQITGNIAGQAGTVASISANSLTTAQVTNAITAFALTNVLGNALNAAQVTGLSGTYAPLANPTFTGTVTLQTMDNPTNTWAVNTDFGLGTNGFYTVGGTVTLGVTGIANVSTSTERYGELTIVSTGTLTFTNPASFKTSDFVSTRVITNGNTAVIAVAVIPGQCTNLAIVQFK